MNNIFEKLWKVFQEVLYVPTTSDLPFINEPDNFFDKVLYCTRGLTFLL